jgi:hypothetical protein
MDGSSGQKNGRRGTHGWAGKPGVVATAHAGTVLWIWGRHTNRNDDWKNNKVAQVFFPFLFPIVVLVNHVV